MKWIKALLAVFVAVALTSTPLLAGTKVIKDNDGNEWVIDIETAATPGAGSGEGAIIAAVSDTLPGYATHKFDLQFGLNLAGTASDDSSGTEAALTGLTLYHRPNDWIRWGPQLMWNAVDHKKVTFGIPVGFKIAPNPWSAYNYWLNVDMLPRFTVETGTVEGPRKSAWTWAPGAAFSVEVPMGSFSLEGGLGASFPFSIEGVTDQSQNPAVEQIAYGANVMVNYRIR